MRASVAVIVATDLEGAGPRFPDLVFRVSSLRSCSSHNLTWTRAAHWLGSAALFGSMRASTSATSWKVFSRGVFRSARMGIRCRIGLGRVSIAGRWALLETIKLINARQARS